MRTETHITETRSIKKLLNVLPDAWVVRELTERDYGTDLVVEVFGLSHDNAGYYPTGATLNIQVKGTTKELCTLKKNDVISFNLSVSFLKYALKFPVPFILVVVDLTKPNTDGIYFLWLQRYVFDVLDEERQDWREFTQDTITVRIPIENCLLRNVAKLEKIAYSLPKLEQLVKYNEIYSLLEPAMTALANGQYDCRNESLSHLKAQIKKIMRLTVLLNNNDCCVSYCDFKHLLDLLNGCESQNEYSALLSFPHWHNMSLLAESISSTHFVDNFVAENQGVVVY